MAGERPVLSSNLRQAFTNDLRHRSKHLAYGLALSRADGLTILERVS